MVKKIIKRAEDIRQSNSNWRNYQEEVNSYVIPRKSWINTLKIRGERLRFNFLFDSTAIRSLKIMAAGFHSNLTNPSTKWFNLRSRDLSLMDKKGVQIWFKQVEDIIFGVLNSSNFDTTMQEFYLSVGSGGTSAVLTQRDTKEKVRFTEIPVEQLGFEEDANGRVNAMYRNFPLTVQQAHDLWGDAAGEVVMLNIEKKPDMMLQFIHFVGPRAVFDSSKIDNKNMPFSSIWIEVSKQHKIMESGYKTFPYAVGRFYKDSSDPMGYSPAMDVLADIKLVNAQVKTMLRASMKQADPALILPDKGFILPLNSNPGASNYRKEGTSSDDLKEMPSSGNIPITIEVIKMVQEGIKAAFFVPLFTALSEVTKTMTIPEIQRRISENMVLLGPTVGRFTQDVLDNIILRVFSILADDGELPPAPEILQDQELDIVYISPLAKAQRITEVHDIESFLADVAAVAQFKPEAIDNVDEDKVVRIIARIRAVNPEILHDTDTVAAIRKQRMEVAQEQIQMDKFQQGAEIVKTGAEASQSIKED